MNKRTEELKLFELIIFFLSKSEERNVTRGLWEKSTRWWNSKIDLKNKHWNIGGKQRVFQNKAEWGAMRACRRGKDGKELVGPVLAG